MPSNQFIMSNIAIFASGSGTNAENIINYFSGRDDIVVQLVLSNKKDAYVLKRAKDNHIPTYTFSREEFYNSQLVMDQLQRYNIDFVVLARYMQILSSGFIKAYPDRIINIHHSFLPAFPGAKPYHSAYERGVKIMGATSHYVTEQLDAGPIIAQDVTRISHTDSVNNLMRRGQDLEKIVLSRAVYAHINRKILIYNNRTIVFS